MGHVTTDLTNHMTYNILIAFFFNMNSNEYKHLKVRHYSKKSPNLVRD